MVQWKSFEGDTISTGGPSTAEVYLAATGADYAIEATAGSISANPALIEILGTSTALAWQSTQGTIDYEVQGDGSKVKVHIMIPRPRVFENESFTVHAQFRNGSASATPDSVRYRIDCLETGEVLQDWTTVTASSQVYIPIAASINEPKLRQSLFERKQLTVEANDSLATAHRDKLIYRVENIRQMTA